MTYQIVVVSGKNTDRLSIYSFDYLAILQYYIFIRAVQKAQRLYHFGLLPDSPFYLARLIGLIFHVRNHIEKRERLSIQ